MKVMEILKEGKAKLLKEIQENANNQRKLKKNQKDSEENTNTKVEEISKFYKYSHEKTNQELKETNYQRPRNRSNEENCGNTGNKNLGVQIGLTEAKFMKRIQREKANLKY